MIVQPTNFKTIPAYLRAVTILQPEGNIPAEVTEALKAWGKPTSFATRQQGILSQVGVFFKVLLSSICIATGLGTLFSLVYPRVEIDSRLGSFFLLAGWLLVLSTRGIWKFLGHRTK